MCIAERGGFEPPVPLSTAVFKTAVIDHSTISPDVNFSAKVRLFYELSKFWDEKELMMSVKE